MPKRPRSHVLEDLSRTQLRLAFEREGWTVEDLAKDYGEDLLVRIFEKGNATPFSFFVQAKATDNMNKYFSERSYGLSFPVETGHIRHWVRFAEPVFLTVLDSASGTTFWVCVQDFLDSQLPTRSGTSGRKTARIVVPRNNVLNSDGLRRMQGITKLRFGRLSRHTEAVNVLIDALKSRGVIVQEFNPNGGNVILSCEDGGSEIYCFGELADLLVKMGDAMHLPIEEMMHRSINELYTRVMDGTYDIEAAVNWFLEDQADRERIAAEE